MEKQVFAWKNRYLVQYIAFYIHYCKIVLMFYNGQVYET